MVHHPAIPNLSFYVAVYTVLDLSGMVWCFMKCCMSILDYYCLVVMSALFLDSESRQPHFGHSSDDRIKSIDLSVY